MNIPCHRGLIFDFLAPYPQLVWRPRIRRGIRLKFVPEVVSGGFSSVRFRPSVFPLRCGPDQFRHTRARARAQPPFFAITPLPRPTTRGTRPTRPRAGSADRFWTFRPPPPAALTCRRKMVGWRAIGFRNSIFNISAAAKLATMDEST